VVLRAVTRAAGVSPNAAYRHFADRDQLLGAVAALCLERLSDLIETRLAEMAPDPDWFRTAFGATCPADPTTIPDERNPLTMLNKILDDLVAVGALPTEGRPGAEYAAWSAVHGIATLIVDGPLAEVPTTDRTQIVNKVIDVVLAGL
jgi:AcrR family transcriptional regulator